MRNDNWPTTSIVWVMATSAHNNQRSRIVISAKSRQEIRTLAVKRMIREWGLPYRSNLPGAEEDLQRRFRVGSLSAAERTQTEEWAIVQQAAPKDQGNTGIRLPENSTA